MRLLKRLSAPVGAVVLLASLSTNLILPERSTLVAVLLGAGLFLVLLALQVLSGRPWSKPCAR